MLDQIMYRKKVCEAGQAFQGADQIWKGRPPQSIKLKDGSRKMIFARSNDISPPSCSFQIVGSRERGRLCAKGGPPLPVLRASQSQQDRQPVDAGMEGLGKERRKAELVAGIPPAPAKINNRGRRRRYG